jgi:hypothetical protein
MRVALTIDSFVEGQGGVSTAVAALARTLRERGHIEQDFLRHVGAACANS